MADWGDSILLTVAQIRGLGQYCTPPAITGLPYIDSDYENVLHAGADLQFSIDKASAREQHLRESDLTISLRVPAVNATDCHTPSGFDWNGVSISHRDNVGLYGPGPAQDHTDWVGSGGANSPDGAGAFSVTASGIPALKLTLACNYDVRQGNVPLSSAPEGPPIIYWVRKADYYYATEAVRESAYCWLGFAWMNVTFNAPSACDLTMRVVYNTYSYADNHLTDSTRSSSYKDPATAHTATFTVPLIAGANTIPVCIGLPEEGGHPLFERVVSVSFEGFSDGNWTIGEPSLVLDAETGGLTSVKTFEGAVEEYRKGGFSATCDAVYEYYAGDQSNRNWVEKTLPFFDQTIGASSGYDLTTAFSLTTFADLIEATSEAFSASLYTAGYEAACKDNEAPQNTLGFDICYPAAHKPTRPLQQNIDNGYLNCCIRCGTWTMVPGIRYLVLPDKIFGGRAHGRALSTDSPPTLARNKDRFTQMWRRSQSIPDPLWARYKAVVGSDAAGLWRSANLEELEGYAEGAGGSYVPLWWLYGVSGPGAQAPAYEIGAAYAREWIAHELVWAALKDPRIVVDLAGRTWRIVDADVTCPVEVLPPEFTVGSMSAWEVRGMPFMGNYERPDIAVLDDGAILGVATNTDTAGMDFAILRQYTGGDSAWEAVTTATLGAGLQRGGICHRFGLTWLCGWAEDKIWVAVSGNAALTRDELANGVTLKEVCDAIAEDDEIPGSDIQVLDDGALLVIVGKGGGQTTYRARSLAYAFEAVA